MKSEEFKDNIQEYVDRYICNYKKSYGEDVRFSTAVVNAFRSYSWQNESELSDLLDKLLSSCSNGFISLRDLPRDFLQEKEVTTEFCETLSKNGEGNRTSIINSQINLSEVLADYEKNLIQDALRNAQGNISQAAVFLGIKRTTLHEKIKRFAIAD